MMWLKTLLRRWLGVEALETSSTANSEKISTAANDTERSFGLLSASVSKDFKNLQDQIDKLRAVVEAQEQAHRQQPRQARTFREVQQFMGSDDAN
jgi:hypothetical protein